MSILYNIVHCQSLSWFLLQVGSAGEILVTFWPVEADLRDHELLTGDLEESQRRQHPSGPGCWFGSISRRKCEEKKEQNI